VHVILRALFMIPLRDVNIAVEVVRLLSAKVNIPSMLLRKSHLLFDS
jgi:hypothetical protein